MPGLLQQHDDTSSWSISCFTPCFVHACLNSSCSSPQPSAGLLSFSTAQRTHASQLCCFRCPALESTLQLRMMSALCSSMSAPSTTPATRTLTWDGPRWPSPAGSDQLLTSQCATWCPCRSLQAQPRRGPTAGFQCCLTTCWQICMLR
jgi:hypothetical protein